MKVWVISSGRSHAQLGHEEQRTQERGEKKVVINASYRSLDRKRHTHLLFTLLHTFMCACKYTCRIKASGFFLSPFNTTDFAPAFPH